MANQSALHLNGVNVRAAGSKDITTGLTLGGIYFPEHTTAAGKHVNAKWEGQFFINQLGYTDGEGVEQPGKNVPIRITFWNGKNAKDGKGLADIAAKCVSVGKELSAAFRMDHFEKRLFLNGIPQVDNLGQPIKIPSYGFLIKSDLQWGADSANVVAQEVANWQGQSNFFSRPPQWNVQNTADNEAWKLVVATRMATPYNGEATYGYARVIIPEGATIVNKSGQPIAQQAPVSNIPAPPASVPAPPAPTAGPTYEQLIAAGWTALQIAGQAEYAHLKPAGSVPAPPALPAQAGALPTTAATGMGASPISNPGI